MREALRRVSVRPTARGWQAIFFGGLSLVTARLIGTTQIYQLAYALAGLLLVAFVLGLGFFWGLGYARRLPAGERFVAGHPSHVEIEVRNESRRRTPGVEVVDHLPKRRLFVRPPVEGLGKRANREPVLFSRRGLYELGPAQVRTSDPFGLWRFGRRFEERAKVLVYPEVFDLMDFPVRGRGTETGAQGALARRGDEFSDLREYRHGDDRRHIHWKSVARTGELIVKEFAHSAPRRHAVVLDLQHTGTNIPEIEVEDAVSAAGSVVRHLAREGLPFRLLCADKARGATAFGDDEAAYWRAMHLLATVQADGDTNTSDFLAGKLREEHTGLGEGVVLVLRSRDDGIVKSVQGLRAAGIFVVVVALATHTYRAASGTGCEDAFLEHVRRLRLAGAEVRVVRRPGGVAAFAGARRRMASVRGVV